jgi:hypothetical protein
MNYVREINLFYDFLETNTVPDSGIVLWHALMHINNKTGWVPEFAVAISTLSTKTGLKKDAIIRARHRLQQAGRLDFTSRTGQQSAVYRIIPFESFIPTQTATQKDSVVFTDTNRVTNREQTASQTENKPLPLLSSLNPLSSYQVLDKEKEKYNLLRLVNEMKVDIGGPLGLDRVYSYIGVVEPGVIELALKGAKDKHLNYFVKVIDNWIKEGRTTVALVLPVPKPGELPPEQPKSGKRSWQSPVQTSGSLRSGKPVMKVVGRGDDNRPPTDEELESMLALAADLSGTSGSDLEEKRRLAREMAEESKALRDR